LAVVFALGYKYDFVRNKFIKTGSFEVRTNIGSDVYINYEYAGNTSFISKAFSKGQLLPRTYDVRLEKEGYQPWEKLMTIEAGFFTSFPRVVLMPAKFNEEVIATTSFSSISSVLFDSEEKSVIVTGKHKIETISFKNGQKILKPKDKNTIAIKKNQGTNHLVSPDENKTAWFNDKEIWAEWLNDSKIPPYKASGTQEIITRSSQRVQDIQWYKDSEHLIVQADGILKFMEIDTRGGLNIFDISTVSGPFYYDQDSDAIFKFTGNNLVKIPLK